MLYEQLSKERILSKVSDYQIYTHYIGNVGIPCTIRSPLPNRKDKIPSFSLYNMAGRIVWKDHTLAMAGDVFKFVMILHNVDFVNSLIQINKDLNLGLAYRQNGKYIEGRPTHVKRIQPKILPDIKIRIKIHEVNGKPAYTGTDIEYWSKRITNVTKTLVRNHTYSTQFMFVNNALVWEYCDSNPIYSYEYEVDNQYGYKCYRPYANKETEKKFYNDLRSISDKALHGLWYLKESDDKLIVTKSAKDCIVLDNCGYSVVAIQGEGNSQPIHPDILADLKQRYKHIYLLYDNDYNKAENWGQLNAIKVASKYEFKNIVIPDNYRCTDADELVVQHGRKELIKLMDKLIG